MNLYRAVVAYASSSTGEIRVRIPAILGPTEVIPISKIGRSATDGTWPVPLLGSQVVVAVEDNRFSNVYLVYPNLGSASTGGDPGGGGGDPGTGITIPSGSIMQYAGTTEPDGWLFCRGESKLVSELPDLFTAIGYTYGGSGANFNLPNLQGKIPFGYSTSDTTFNSLTNSGGIKTQSLIEANLPAHAHSLSAHTHSLTHNHSMSHTHSGSTDQDSHNHGSISSSGSHQHNVPGYRNQGTPVSGSGVAVLGTPGDVSFLTVSGGGSHGHTINTDYHSHGLDTGQPSPSTTSNNTTTDTTGPSTTNTGNGSGTGQSFSVLPPYIVVNYIIKV
jgi:microcystin-dependent protein